MKSTTALHRGWITTVLSTLAMTLVGASLAGSWTLSVCADPNSMPFSHTDETGFENHLARLLAEELDADLEYLWWPLGPSMFERIREGDCDVIMGIPDGLEPLLSTLSYYRSPYVFVSRTEDDYKPFSLDDPELATLRLGVQRSGSPVHEALLYRGLGSQVVLQYADRGYGDHGDPLSPLFEAVAAGEVDVALSWGPAAGYFAARQNVPLTVTPLNVEFDPTFLRFVIPMTIGVRRGDEALRDRLGVALASRWDEVQALLGEFEVPLSSLQRPIVGGE